MRNDLQLVLKTRTQSFNLLAKALKIFEIFLRRYIQRVTALNFPADVHDKQMIPFGKRAANYMKKFLTIDGFFTNILEGPYPPFSRQKKLLSFLFKKITEVLRVKNP